MTIWKYLIIIHSTRLFHWKSWGGRWQGRSHDSQVHRYRGRAGLSPEYKSFIFAVLSRTTSVVACNKDIVILSGVGWRAEWKKSNPWILNFQERLNQNPDSSWLWPLPGSRAIGRHANPARPKSVIRGSVFSNFTPFSVTEKLIFSNVSVIALQ